MIQSQKDIWQKEYKAAAVYTPETAKDKSMQPSSNMLHFLEWLREHDVPLKGNVVDIGSGKGRNAIYLAQLGFNVFAMDFIHSALMYARDHSKTQKVDDKINIYQVAIDERWPFGDDVFDIAIDNYSSLNIDTAQGRLNYLHELLRTLKKGGYALVTVVSSEDEVESELVKTSPGEEAHSTISPSSGKFQKNYTEEELREFYKDFEIEELRTIKKKANKLGRNFMATDFWLVLRKV